MRLSLRITLLFALLLSGFKFSPGLTARAADEATDDTPSILVPTGVYKYALAAPKLFWYTGVPQCGPALAAASASEAAVTYTETIARIATYGSETRQLYVEQRQCDEGQVLSNIVADANYLYWLGPVAVMRLSTNANPGDAPQIFNALMDGSGEVADGGDKLFVMSEGSTPSIKEINYIRKDNGQRVFVTTTSSAASSLQTDGSYVYFVNGGALVRVNPGVDNGVTLSTGVTGYYPEGRRLLFCTINPVQCSYSDNVYVAKGRQIYVYNNNTGTLGATPIYTSADTQATVYSMVTSGFLIGGSLFLLERRPVACGDLICPTTYVLIRTGRSGGAVSNLYAATPSVVSAPPYPVTTDGTFVFWQENGALKRLPTDASALPEINLSVTGMEVTQGIQNLNNAVGLIKGKRTFVRVYVKSAGPAVSGVTARLSAPSLGGTSLSPVNPAGANLTVRTNPSRNDIDQSFLFELPWNWTEENNLSLHADLNPFKFPLEPNYADNISTVVVAFGDSPRLSAEFFRLNYTIGGTTYRPRISADVLKTYSWILRAYPIGGAVGDRFKPRLWDVEGGTQLGNWVRQSSIECVLTYLDPDDRSLCASYFTNGWLFYYRVATQFGVLNVGLNTNAFYYGMISDASNNFPRGQAVYSKTSVGPTGTPGQFFSLGQGWDTDGSYADWYAAHEIGHSLNRAHPYAGSDNPATSNTLENCGHSRSDSGYPYGNTSSARAPIGPADNTMEGFDVGDPAFGISKAVLPSSTWNDVMSYCSNQWISDYTYNAMKSYMVAHPSVVAADAGLTVAVTGDFLVLAGAIDPEASSAGFSFVRRLADVADVPPLTDGGYSIRLVDGSNAPFANYPFTPETVEGSDGLGFGLVVDFVAGTRAIQIVRNSDGHVMGSAAVSSNAPTISGVALQSATSPVSGVVTLVWTANDADGDELVFDVAYSRDNGATFQPVAINLSGSSAQIDTASLGGSGAAILRVTASDGVNSASADSASFIMAPKPPQPYILTPADNTTVLYGQLVNFSAMAFDAQDGTVAPSGFTWKNAQGSSLGTGPLLSMDDLPVGTNVITLEVINSVGQTATATVIVIVEDDLSLLGPTLTVGPSRVGWHVGAGATDIQMAEINVNNAGSGALEWTATSNQAWLTLDMAAGTIAAGDDPTKLTLSADPAGLAPEKTHVAEITLTRLAGSTPAQTVVVPVTLSIGDVWTEPVHAAAPVSSAAGLRVFLPAITR